MTYSDYFYYDESSPSCLRNRIDRLGGKDFKSPVAVKGEVSGCTDNRGYWIVRLHNKSVKGHQIVWELHKGVIPKGYVVDHIDGDTSNNKLVNLRLVTSSLNSRNREFKPTDNNPLSGVSLYTNCKKGVVYRCWRVSYQGRFGRGSKDFSIIKFGELGARDLAVEFRELYNEMSGNFTERHTRRLDALHF